MCLFLGSARVLVEGHGEQDLSLCVKWSSILGKTGFG